MKNYSFSKVVYWMSIVLLILIGIIGTAILHKAHGQTMYTANPRYEVIEDADGFPAVKIWKAIQPIDTLASREMVWGPAKGYDLAFSYDKTVSMHLVANSQLYKAVNSDIAALIMGRDNKGRYLVFHKYPGGTFKQFASWIITNYNIVDAWVIDAGSFYIYDGWSGKGSKESNFYIRFIR